MKKVVTYTEFIPAHDRLEIAIYVQDDDIKYRLDGRLENTKNPDYWDSANEILVAFSKYVSDFKIEE